MARVSQDITDISSPDQLLRYAVAGQLTPLLEQGYRQEEIAVSAGLGSTTRNAGPVLAKALAAGFTQRQLRGLDEVIGALAPDLDRAGGLSSLAWRLSAGRPSRGKTGDIAIAVNIPPSWASRLLADPPAGEIGVLMQASGLLSEFVAAGKTGRHGAVTSIQARYRVETDLLSRRLALLAAGPPTSRSHDAQNLLGLLASYCFDQTRDTLERMVRYSPVGFRTWQAVTQLVGLSRDAAHTEAVRNWIRELLRDSGELRRTSLNPGASYDLELALTIPPEWSPPGDDWVGAVLRDRARDGEATLLERGTAAMGLWQRVIAEDRPDLKETENELRALVAEFRDPDTRPDAAAGLRWIAAALEGAMDTRQAICNDWPDVSEPWYRHVLHAADELGTIGIPDHLVAGTKNLFLHMILQNAGTYRNQAIETVVTSGLNRPVAMALSSLLRTETQESWLRVRAQAALSFMQRSDVAAQSELTRTCLHAHATVKTAMAGQDPVRSKVTELATSLFAVADCFASDTGWENGRHARDMLRPLLSDLADADDSLTLRRPARAAAYLLALTAQPAADGREDLSQELLEKLRAHPDPVTSRLSSWVLSFRFAPDGAIRPMLAAAELGAAHDTPFKPSE